MKITPLSLIQFNMTVVMIIKLQLTKCVSNMVNQYQSSCPLFTDIKFTNSLTFSCINIKKHFLT